MLKTIIKYATGYIIALAILIYIFLGAILQGSYKNYPITEHEKETQVFYNFK